MSKLRLDVRALHDALDQCRRARRLSWRQVAAEAGVSASTLSRMTKEKRPDVDSFAALVGWLDVSADTFLRGGAPADGRGSLAALASHVREATGLSPDKVSALQDLLAAVDRLMDA